MIDVSDVALAPQWIGRPPNTERQKREIEA